MTDRIKEIEERSERNYSGCLMPVSSQQEDIRYLLERVRENSNLRTALENITQKAEKIKSKLSVWNILDEIIDTAQDALEKRSDA